MLRDVGGSVCRRSMCGRSGCGRSYGVEGGRCVEVQCDAGDVCVITLMCVGVSVYKNCGLKV